MWVPAFAGMTLLLFSMFPPLSADLSLDSERLNLEMTMQKRVEDALSKIFGSGAIRGGDPHPSP